MPTRLSSGLLVVTCALTAIMRTANVDQLGPELVYKTFQTVTYASVVTVDLENKYFDDGYAVTGRKLSHYSIGSKISQKSPARDLGPRQYTSVRHFRSERKPARSSSV